jgi:hypothetical protein
VKCVTLGVTSWFVPLVMAVWVECSRPSTSTAGDLSRSKSSRATKQRTKLRGCFVREAHAAGQLRHPNIVAVQDIGQVRGALYIVMEYLRGAPLTTFIPGPPSLTLKAKLSIMAQTADALGHAHSQGVVHRDVKPANIMIVGDESVKVVDFGIAELAGLPSSVVQGGTLPYMSPEQLGGQSLDCTSDIWSAGVTLYELLVGRLPYRSVQEIVSTPVPPLPGSFPLSGDLNAVLARTMAKDRQMRYRTAERLAADLRTMQQMCDNADLGANESELIDDAAGRVFVMPARSAVFDSATLTLAAGDACSERTGPVAQARPAVPVDEAATVHNYRLPNLNFMRPAQGALETKIETYAWKERKRVLGERRERIFLPLFGVRRRALDRLSARINRSLTAVLLLLPLILMLMFASFFIAALAWLTLTASMVVCSGLDVPAHMPRCRSCRLRMGLTARWTRLCKTREEVSFGLRDCMAALRHRLWQDAAKLLSLYGAEYASEYGSRFITPTRYHVSFFECTLCGHHVARLTTDEMVGGRRERADQVCGSLLGHHHHMALTAATFGDRLRVISQDGI